MIKVKVKKRKDSERREKERDCISICDTCLWALCLLLLLI